MNHSEPIVTGKTHYALFLLSLIYVFSYIDRLIISVLVEPIKAEFGVSDTMIGLLTGVAFALFYTAFGLPLGRLSDRIGRKPVIAIACIAWSVLTMLSGIVTSFLLLVILRIGVAIGEAGASAPSVAMISELYPARSRSRALAVFGLGPALGAILGIGLGGLLAETYGWRATLVIVGAPGIAIGLLLAFTAKGPKPTTSSSALAAEESLGETVKMLFRTPGFWQIIATGSTAAITGYAIQMWTPSFMIRSHSLSVQEAGMLMGIAGGLMAVIGTLFCGYVADKLSARDPGWQLGTALLGTGLSIPLALAFYMWPSGTAFMLGDVAVPAGFLFYIGFAFFGVWWTVPCYGALAQMLPANKLAQGTAFFFMGVTLLGAGLGPLIAGAISDALTASMGLEGLRYALVCAAVLLLVPCMFLLGAIPKYRGMIIDGQNSKSEPLASGRSNSVTS